MYDLLIVFAGNRKWPRYAYTIYLNHTYVWPIIKCLLGVHLYTTGDHVMSLHPK